MSFKKKPVETEPKPSNIGSRAIPCLTVSRWIWIGIVSLIVGGLLYGAVTSLAYYRALARAQNAPAKLFERLTVESTEATSDAESSESISVSVASSAVASTIKSEEKDASPSRKSIAAANPLGTSMPGDLFARSRGIEFSSMQDPMRLALVGAFKKPSDPMVQVAAQFLRPGISKECERRLRQRMATALARQLVGWPGDTAEDTRLLQKASDPPSGDGDQQKTPAQLEAETAEECASYASPPLHVPDLPGLLWRRTEASTGRDLAVRVLGVDACLPGGTSAEADKNLARCTILQGLLGAATATEAVKQSRMWANFFWGWERFAVAVLFMAVVLAMSTLRRQRLPLERQAREIAGWLRYAEARLSKIRFTSDTSDATAEAHALYDKFRTEYGVKFDSKKHAKFTKDGACLADSDGLCVIKGNSPTALRDLLDANRECVGAADRNHLEKVVELQTQALARQRAFINALITAFPAIGLVATLHGLIVALSRASGIVAGSEADRLSATELVTGVLSSSFATTMLALTAMAICMLLNTREEHREAGLLEDAHRRLNAVFWPGR